MDGTDFVRTRLLGDVVDIAMRQQLSFSAVRQLVYDYLKSQQCFLITVDRVTVHNANTILVVYYDANGDKQIESYDECALYTKLRPVSTW
jgi:hypothetical protein